MPNFFQLRFLFDKRNRNSRIPGKTLLRLLDTLSVASLTCITHQLKKKQVNKCQNNQSAKLTKLYAIERIDRKRAVSENIKITILLLYIVKIFKVKLDFKIAAQLHRLYKCEY